MDNKNHYQLLSEKFRKPIHEIEKILGNTILIMNKENYQNSKSILKFKCNQCNTEFEKRIGLLINKSGCPTCVAKSLNKNINSTSIFHSNEEIRKNNWIDKCNQLYPNLFDFSKVVYKNKDTKVILGCLKCQNEFEVTPHQIVSKPTRKVVGCSKCNCKQRGEDRILSQEDILERIDAKWVVIDWLNYKNINDYIDIECVECKSKYNRCIKNLLNDMGCKLCYNNRRGDTLRFNNEKIIEKFQERWGNLFDYSKVTYVSMWDPVAVICKEHGEFQINPHEHERGQGCPDCNWTTEKHFLKYLKTKFPDIIHQFKIDTCKNKKHLPFDYYIPSIKTIIEIDGKQHFEKVKLWDNNVEINIERDIFKMKKAIESGYKIIHIYQEDIYSHNEKWFDTNIYPQIINNNLDYTFISLNKNLYNKHKAFMNNTFQKEI